MASGHAVRGTTRDPARRAAIEAVGAEGVLGDPDVVATLARSLEHVSVACVLLGSAAGPPAQLAALHGTRLAMLLERMLDTTVRGIVYEAAGSVEQAVLDAGAARVRERCEDSRIPYALLDVDPAGCEAWLSAAVKAVDRVLTSRPGSMADAAASGRPNNSPQHQ
jgi:hypothetical protein